MKLFLIGLPGSGKSSVGKRLAELLAAPFIDTDTFIERDAGMSIPEIFASSGEAGFRKIEQRVVAATCKQTGPLVVATGGGAIVHEPSARAMRKAGRLIWLYVPVDVAVRRTRGGGRPLLEGDPLAAMTALARTRDAIYEKVSHRTIDASASNVDGIVEQVAAAERLPCTVSPYNVHVGAGVLESVGEIVQADRAVMVEDENVRTHANVVAHSLKSAGTQLRRVRIPAGERSKSRRSLDHLYDEFADARADRHTPVVAVGGGVVGDLAGFAAATWLRGVPVIQVPTTLLAQVDSSIGGKTAINHSSGKNRIGAFHQPAAVISDVRCLSTLEPDEFKSGLGEVLKYGAAMDRAFFDWLQRAREVVNGRSEEALIRVVLRCARLKSRTVAKDERESSGARALLNVGHTIGHALEAATKYRRFSHGEAVAAGLILETQLAAQLELCSDRVVHRATEVVEAFGLPTQARAKGVRAFLAADKKRKGQDIDSYLLTRIGKARRVQLPVSVWKTFVRKTIEGES